LSYNVNGGTRSGEFALEEKTSVEDRTKPRKDKAMTGSSRI
jgi:hypothetical protein